MQPDSGLRTWQWVVTAIVVIALIVIGVMIFGKKSPGSESPEGAGTAVSNPNIPGVNSIVMSDQYPGNVAYLSSVQLAKGGWVVIHKDNGGEPGDIIGTVWANQGIGPAKVNLTSPLIDGLNYHAMLRSDNGDRVFDATADLILRDGNGNLISRMFRATVSADQSTKG